MKYIKLIILFSLLFSCSKKNSIDTFPDYKLIKDFSEKIEPITGLVLYSYAINTRLPDDYQFINGVGSFSASYYLSKTKQDVVSLEEARNLLVSVAENFLQEINSNTPVRPLLDIYPLTIDRIRIDIHFKDENRIDLGQGISTVYFSKEKIEYKRYEIREYRSRYPSIGKHFTVREETYAEALDIVRKQGSMVQL